MVSASITNVADSLELATLDLGAKAATEDVSRELLLLVFVLPKKQGMEVCKQIHRDPSLKGLPIAVLKLLNQDVASVLGLAKPTDDQLTQPDPTATVAGIKKLLSCKSAPAPPLEGVIEVGDLIIDPISYRVTRAGKRATLTKLEFQLLYYLAARPNRPFTRHQLFNAVWGGGRSSNPRVVDVYIWRVRAKIEPDPQHPAHLKTLIGRGYQFV